MNKLAEIVQEETFGKFCPHRPHSYGCLGNEEECVCEHIAKAVIDAHDPVDHLKTLTPEQRKEVFAQFCIHCGSDNPTCQCWNDE